MRGYAWHVLKDWAQDDDQQRAVNAAMAFSYQMLRFTEGACCVHCR